jgi:hypothetical protein
MGGKKIWNKDNKQFFDMFDDLRWDVIIRFVDIGEIVDRRCIHIVFIVKNVLAIFKYVIFLLLISAQRTFICISIMLISIFRISLQT